MARTLRLLLFVLAARLGGVEEEIEKAVADAKLKDAKLGICVVSSKSGRTIYRRDETAPLLLASNTKLLTTSCALAKLGADYAFRTVVGLEDGELHVFGGGDPNLSGRFHDDDPTAVFRGWAAKLKEAKVAKVGAVVLHAGLFDKEYVHPDWIEAKYAQDEWWCAPVGALSLNDNCVDLLYEAGAKEGDPVKVTARPDTAYVTIVNRAKTVAGDAKPIGFSRKAGTNEITVRGELKVGTKSRVAWVAIQDPTKYFGTVLKEQLERAGVACGEVREDETLQKDHPKLRVVHVEESDLPRTLQACNQPSQNFYAEMICKTLGARFGPGGTDEAGTAVIVEWLKSIGIEDAALSDGCGLSTKNRGSAASLVKLLSWWRGRKEFKVLYESLPVSGTSGTIKRRMASIAGKVHAKTGHIEGVSALSGYVECGSGDTAVFSIVANRWAAGSPDRLQDRICEILAKDE